MAECEQGLEEGGPDLRVEAGEMVKKHSSEAFYAFDDPLEVQYSRCSLS